MNPKCVYLDLKDWIGISKDFYQRGKEEIHFPELEWILKSVASGEICFPLVDTLFLEFYKNSTPSRRSKLAIIMSTLSLGCLIADKRSRLAYEARIALAKMFNQSLPNKEIMIVRGLSRAFVTDEELAHLTGLNINRISRIIEATDSVDAWIDFFDIVDEVTRKFLVNKFREANDRHTEMLEIFRKSNNKNPDLQLRIYYARLFSDTQDTILKIMDEYGLSKNELFQLDGATLSSEIPTYEIESKLTIEAMKQKSRSLENNDYYDIASLAAAIPYCSVVITEAFWVDLCKRLKFDQKYNCKLLTDYKQLPNNI